MAYAKGTYALGICDRCGATFKLNELRYEVVLRKRTGLRVCSDCNDPDHPQLFTHELRVLDDPKPLKDPRPDYSNGRTFFGDTTTIRLTALTMGIAAQGMDVLAVSNNNFLRQLVGVEMTSTANQITAPRAITLTGLTFDSDLTGVGATAVSNITRALTGIRLTPALGSMAAPKTLPLSGTSFASSLGSMAAFVTTNPDISKALSGVGMAAAVTKPNIVRSKALTGQSAIAAAQGTMNNPKTTGKIPVITETTPGLIPNGHWNDPYVIAENGGYTMWASCVNNFTTYDIRIYRLRSTDRINWVMAGPQGTLGNVSNYVLQMGAAGEWDSSAVETPSVVFYGGEYKLFYTGYDGTFSDSSRYKIGFATSPDGITWTKGGIFLQPNDPFNATPNFTYDQWIVGEPGAVVFNNKLYVYFTAVGANQALGQTMQTIGLTIFDPAVGTWDTPRQVIVPNQTLYPAATWYGFSTPAAGILPDGRIGVFCSLVTRNPWSQVKIINLASVDGISGWVDNVYPVINNTDAAWSSVHVIGACLQSDGGNLNVWHGGDNGSSLGIGYHRY